MDRYFGIYGRHLGLSMPDFLALGRPASDGQSEFCMTLLALRLSSHHNGVSKLHGNITRPDVATFVAGSRCRRDPDSAHHQRRASSQLDFPRDEPALRSLSNGRTGVKNLLTTRFGIGCTPSQRKSSGALMSGGENALSSGRATGCAHEGCAAARPEREIEAADEVLDPAALIGTCAWQQQQQGQS